MTYLFYIVIAFTCSRDSAKQKTAFACAHACGIIARLIIYLPCFMKQKITSSIAHVRKYIVVKF